MLPYNLSVLPCVLNHLEEYSLFLQQLERRASFDDPPAVHHDDLVVVCDSVEPMRDRYHRRLFELLSDYLLNEGVGLHVHVGSGLVKHQQLVAA